MYEPTLPGPVQFSPRKEHAAADPTNARTLKARIPENLDTLARLAGKHMVAAADFQSDLILQIFRLAARFESGEFADRRPLTGKILSNVFLDSSRNHTRLSFNSAWLRLGGTLMNFEKSVDEVTRGRSASDEVAELCNNYGDIAVLRTLDADSFSDMLDYFRVPVINAGNGNDQHPTHAMADLYTLFKWRPDLMGLDGKIGKPIQIAVFGNPSRTRTIKSFLDILAKFPKAVERIVVFERLDSLFEDGQREELEDAGLHIETVAESLPLEPDMKAIRRLLPQMDLVYIHHDRPVHAPRMNLIEAVANFKSDALVLNPRIETDEFSQRVNDSANNGYFCQARGAVFVRMAIFAAIMGTRCSVE